MLVLVAAVAAVSGGVRGDDGGTAAAASCSRSLAALQLQPTIIFYQCRPIGFVFIGLKRKSRPIIVDCRHCSALDGLTGQQIRCPTDCGTQAFYQTCHSCCSAAAACFAAALLAHSVELDRCLQNYNPAASGEGWLDG